MPNVGPFDQEISESSSSDAGSEQDSDLGERERRILGFERQWWKFEGSKEQAIRDEFGFSATRYYQLLNGLVERPEAMEFDPLTVKRLRRVRADRRRQRTARSLGIQL